MYAYLVVVTILMPLQQERHVFEMFSLSQFSEPTCQKRAHEIAEMTSQHIAAHIPGAMAQIEISCSPRETRPT